MRRRLRFPPHFRTPASSRVAQAGWRTPPPYFSKKVGGEEAFPGGWQVACVPGGAPGPSVSFVGSNADFIHDVCFALLTTASFMQAVRRDARPPSARITPIRVFLTGGRRGHDLCAPPIHIHGGQRGRGHGSKASKEEGRGLFPPPARLSGGLFPAARLPSDSAGTVLAPRRPAAPSRPPPPHASAAPRLYPASSSGSGSVKKSATAWTKAPGWVSTTSMPALRKVVREGREGGEGEARTG